MLISDLSEGGLMCQVTDYKGLEEGHILTLDYILNDIAQKKIKKQAVIRHRNGMSIGCEFIEL
ncbi:MAG: hypothetical protein WBW79_09590 [Desulfocapsaceae bacterium]